MLMKSFLKINVVCVLLLLVACHSAPDQEDIKNLNGYWEIAAVKKKGAKDREYKFNETVDFIQLEDGKGFRQKVKPTLDGEYKTSNDREELTVKKEGDSVFMFYKTKMDEWKEALLEADKNSFTVENEQGIKYKYKRFKGYLDDGEE